MTHEFEIGDEVIARDSCVVNSHQYGTPRVGIIREIDTFDHTIHVQFDDKYWWFMESDVKPYIKLSDEAGQVWRGIIDEI